MSASVHHSLPRLRQFGRLWWLPFNATGNGLDDTAWTLLADLDGSIVDAVLAELRAAGVPAHAAPVPRSQQPSPPHAKLPDRFHLWVGTSAYGRAEDILRLAMSTPLRKRQA